MVRPFDQPHDDKYGGQVGAFGHPVSVTITRPNNTTQYAAGDVWAGDPLVPTLEDCARQPGGGGYLHAITAVNDDSAATADLDFTLHIFNAPVNIPADNAAYTPNWAELTGLRVCSLDSTDALYEHVINGHVTWDFHANIITFQCAEGDRDLYVVIEVTNTHDPVELGRLYIAAVVGQN